MKKIYYILFAVAALFAFAPFTSAQDVPFPADNSIKFSQTEWNKQYEVSESGVAYRKIISKPNTQGVYHILLDAFVTGSEVKLQKNLAADIVLVLDVSGSMDDDMDGTDHYNWEPANNRRLQAMKNAVSSFIDTINQNDQDNAPQGKQRLGNRIAIVPFNGEVNTGNSSPNRVRNFTALSQASNIKSWVNGLTATGGTRSDLGMQKALDLLANNSDSQLKTVVFFTDGNPGYMGDWENHTWSNNHGGYYYDDNTWATANATINYADQIKDLAVESDDPSVKVISNVFTVSIITEAATSDYTRVYLEKTSSNYLGATNMGTKSTWSTTNIYGNGDGDENEDETDYSLTATSASELENVFKTIADASGGSSESLGEATVSTVDVVSASFMLPPGTEESDIKVYTSRCTGVTTGNQRIFGPDTLATNRKDKYQPMKKNDQGSLVPDGDPKDVDDAIAPHISSAEEGGTQNKITIDGFDYSNNWCGPIEENGTVTGYHGNKVTILIPIKMNPEALGGVGVDTNGPGSGIWVNGKNEFPFESPQVNLPVNIIINKQGLDEGESSKFTILRSTNKTSWEEVTSVFVTRHKGQPKNAPRTRIEGLPATNSSGVEYIYKVREDNWSWSYTLTSESELTSDTSDNPFEFKNTKKDNIDTKIRHAESKATNIFKTKSTAADGGGDRYDDSKTNTKEGRTIITVTSTATQSE